MTTVLITGPTRGLGRAATLDLAARKATLLLVGRGGPALDSVAAAARARGARVHEIPADLARLADVRSAAAHVRELVADGTVPPLDALVANAGTMSADTRRASADGYELTFAVNHLAHAQLIGDLLPSALATAARIVLLGSNTYHQNVWRRLLGVPAADWRDPVALAEPAAGPAAPGMRASGTAYSNAKLAVLYYAHELQRHVPAGVAVTVFEPGWMPATSLSRDAPAAARAVGRSLGRLPGVSSPARSGALLAALAVDPRWSGARDGAFVLKDRVVAVRPVAHDRERERRLWAATGELLRRAVPSDR